LTFFAQISDWTSPFTFNLKRRVVNSAEYGHFDCSWDCVSAGLAILPKHLLAVELLL
jgi:hypothetical protein